MRCGDICLAHFPFTDGSSAKIRPVLVVSSDEYNSGQDIIVLPITSRVDASLPNQYIIDMGHSKFRSARLKRTSAVKTAHPMTIEKSLLQRRLGSLAPAELEQVRGELRKVFL